MDVTIYRIVFPNGKSYIGQTRLSLEKRIKCHKNSAKNKSASGYKVPLMNAIRKYGWDSIKIETLETTSLEISNTRETYYMEKFSSLIGENGYNCVKEVSGGGRIISEETKRNMSLAQINNDEAIKRVKKLGKSNIGRKRSEETKRKLKFSQKNSEAYKTRGEKLKGRKRSEETKERMSKAQKVSPGKDERIENLRVGNIGRKVSEETKKKMSLARKGQMAYNRKKCACFNTDGKKLKEYSCLTDTKLDGHDIANVSSCCRNKQKTHHNLTWKFI